MSTRIIQPLSKHAVDSVTQTLVEAFQQDDLMLWLFGDNEKYKQVAFAVIKTWVQYTVLYGAGYHVPGQASAVLFKKPGDLDMSFWRIIRSGMLKTQTLLGKEGMKRLLYMGKLFQQKKKQLFADEKFLYCWMLGSAPSDRGKGNGSHLMQTGINQFSEYPCYLETQHEQNRRYYEKLGFKEIDRFQLDDTDFPIIGMRRPAKPLESIEHHHN